MTLTAEQKNEIVALAKDLIAQPSPSGQEQGAAAVLRQYMETAGFDRVETDAYGNVLGCLRGSCPGRRVLFDGHIDTVPVPDPAAWTHDPRRW